MIEESAIVTGLVGNRALIQMQRQSACDHCELNHGCGTGALGRLLSRRSKPLAIPNRHNLKIGDRVLLGLADEAFLQASLLIYGLPLMALIGAGLVAQWLFPDSELLIFGIAIVGLLAGLAISNSVATKRFSNQFDPKVLRVGGEPIDRFQV